MENVQIPQELFMKLLRYHLLDDDSCTEEVKNGLEQKMNAMVERELYTRSKTAPTEEEREKARQEYLDRRGIPEDFRWWFFLDYDRTGAWHAPVSLADKEKLQM